MSSFNQGLRGGFISQNPVSSLALPTAPGHLRRPVVLTCVCPDTGWKPCSYSTGLGVHPPLLHKHIACVVDRSGPKEEISLQKIIQPAYSFLSPKIKTVHKTEFLEQRETAFKTYTHRITMCADPVKGGSGDGGVQQWDREETWLRVLKWGYPASSKCV